MIYISQKSKKVKVKKPYILNTLSLLNLSKNHKTNTGLIRPIIRQAKERKNRIWINKIEAFSIGYQNKKRNSFRRSFFLLFI